MRTSPGIRPHAATTPIAVAVGLLSILPPGCAPAFEDEAALRARREAMVRNQIEARGVKDRLVLDAMRRVPRHRFVPAALRDAAKTAIPIVEKHIDRLQAMNK